MSKITVTFERVTTERVTCEFDVGEAIGITMESMNFWANYGFCSASPFSERDRFPQWQTDIEVSKWRAVASDPPLVDHEPPPSRRGSRRKDAAS